MSKSLLIKILGAVAVLAVVAGVVIAVVNRDTDKTLTAQFPRTVSLYEGSDVRILGVNVGEVTSVRPSGETVTVELKYEDKYTLPSDVKAALVSPSIVGDRFIQMTPVFRKGDKALADDAKLGTNRTAVPLELDQIYGSVNDLAIALGPDGVNKAGKNGEGALTRLLRTTAKNFGGQGRQFNTTLKNLGRLTTTLENNKDELFGTARQLEVFISTLAKNDTTVRDFNDSLASAADVLEGEREELAASLRNLGVALTQVRGFVRDNKALLSRNIKGVNRVSKVLVKRRAALDEGLKNAPAALNNLGLAYNPKVGSLDVRADLLEGLKQDPSVVLCSLIGNAPGGAEACDLIKDRLKLPGVPGVPGANRAAALREPTGPPREVQYVDRSLGGLVKVTP